MRAKRKWLKESSFRRSDNFKSSTSDQAIPKAFHNLFVSFITNLRISTAHSCNTDLIVTDGQVKNALIKL